MPDWLAWVIVAAGFAAAEAASLTFVLVMFAGGAAAAALTAALGGPVVVQLLVAVVATLALLGGVRPVVTRHLLAPGRDIATNADALIGQEAVVLSPVDARDGRIRLNGNEWSARSFDTEQVLPAGTVVRVMQISGATALVLPENPSLPSGGPS